MKKTTIEEAIKRIDEWKGKDISYTSVSGGITNPNYKVLVDGKSYFLKIPGDGTDFIDRNNCHLANALAGESLAGPKVYFYFDDTGVEVFEWLEGYRQVVFGDVFDEDMFDKMIKNTRAFHQSATTPLPLEQSLIQQAWDMNALAKETGYLPPWNDRMEYYLNVIDEALKHDGIEYAPCHNDLWTNNMMYNEETGDLKIIDYEYASMSDPYSDLGTLSTMNYFTEAMDVEMIRRYRNGDWNDKCFARMKLYKIVCDIKWGYWSLQQAVNSTIDFDYMAWYDGKAARLQHLWLDPRMDYWLNLLMDRPIFRVKKG